MVLTIYCIIMLCIFLGIVLVGIKREDNTTTRESYLQMLNSLRGIFALEVVFGHLTRYENNFLFLFGKFMICSVAFFFFVSGFGMVVSFDKKKDYLGYRFIFSKPLYLISIAVVIYIAEICIDAVLPYDMGYFNGEPIKMFLYATNWYIWELLLFYALFFISYKFFYKYRIRVSKG